MMKLNEVLKSVRERAGEGSSVSKAVHVLWGQTSSEGSQLSAVRALMEEVAEDGEFYDELDVALRFNEQGVLIEALVKDSEWMDYLDESVKEMPAYSNCGADCLALIIKADLLLSDMADMKDSGIFEDLMAGVARQCEVFVNG